MNTATRRTVLSASVLGLGLMAACSPSRDRTADTSPTADTRDAGVRFGAGAYNTEQVADELRYIEASVAADGGRVARGDAKRILVTGSTGGLGQLAAAHLLARGHRVVAHARNGRRAADVRRDLPGLEAVVVGDLLALDQTRAVAEQANDLGTFDAVIHNAGEYGVSNAEILNANSLSAYLLTSLIRVPTESLVYLTSDLHLGGDLKLDELRNGGTDITYDDSKLHMATLATAVARRHPEVRVNAVAPGWVPTLMGFHNGPHAPDDLREGYLTQVGLVEGTEDIGGRREITGQFLFHGEVEDRVHESVHDEAAQDGLLAAFAARTGVSFV